MNVRRFVLRLAVGLLCFAVGWACAMLLGVAGPRRHEIRRTTRIRVVPHIEMPDLPPPPMPAKSGCRVPRLRHAHEWHDTPRHEEMETMPMLQEFEEHLAPPPPPPPPPAATRTRRGGS